MPSLERSVLRRVHVNRDYRKTWPDRRELCIRVRIVRKYITETNQCRTTSMVFILIRNNNIFVIFAAKFTRGVFHLTNTSKLFTQMNTNWTELHFFQTKCNHYYSVLHNSFYAKKFASLLNLFELIVFFP
jgi:hypothetical protein